MKVAVGQLRGFLDPIQGGHWDFRLQDLSCEEDPQIFWADVLALGRNLLKQKKDALAGQVFQFVSNYPQIPPKIKEQAQKELNALMGSGPTGARLEYLGNRLVDQATDYRLILPMIGATLASQSFRAASLLRMTQSPATWWNRQWMARGMSASLGFAAEVPTFVSMSRGLRQFSGSPLAPLEEEILSASLSLGTLKLSAFLGGQTFHRVHHMNELGMATRLRPLIRFSRKAFPQASLFAGLLASHGIEIKLGLRPQVEGATLITDTLSTFVSLGVGFRLGQGVLGPIFNRHLHALGIRAQVYYQALKKPAPPMPPLGLAWTGRLAFPSPAPYSPSPLIFFTESSGGGGRIHAPTGPKELAKHLKLFELRPQDRHRIPRILDFVDKTEIHEPLQNSYYDLLLKIEPKGAVLSDGIYLSPLETLLYGTNAIEFATALNSFRTGTGSPDQHMIQAVFESMLLRRDSLALGEFIRTLARGNGIPGVEEFLGASGLAREFQLGSPKDQWEGTLVKIPDYYENFLPRLRALNLPGPVFQTVGRYWADSLFSGTSFHNPQYNYLLYRNYRGNTWQKVGLGPREILLGLESDFENHGNLPDYGKDLSNLFQNALNSSVPKIHLDFLFKSMLTRAPYERRMESIQFRSPPQDSIPELWSALPTQPSPYQVRSMLGNSFLAGNFKDPLLLGKLSEYYSMAQNTSKAAENYGPFHHTASEILRHKGSLDLGDFLTLLTLRPTKLSKEAHDSIEGGKVELRIVPESELESWAERGNTPQFLGTQIDGLFLSPSQATGKRPLLLIREIDPNQTLKQKLETTLKRTSFIVHEYEHYNHHSQYSFTERKGLVLAEMHALLEESLFMMANGRFDHWIEAQRISSYGFGFYMRNLVDLFNYSSAPDLIEPLHGGVKDPGYRGK